MSETGIKVARKLLFQCDVNKADKWWQSQMLQAIEVAKRLGFRNFEIDVSGEAAEESPEQDGGLFVIKFSGIFGTSESEDEKWKTEPATDAKTKVKPVRLVRVWALLAVDAREVSA